MFVANLQGLAPDLLTDRESFARLLAATPFIMLLSYLAVTDARHLRLPLPANLALSLTGLLAGGLVFGTLLEDRLIGWASGFLVLQGLASAYRRVRGHDGIGGGDPILLGGIGAWLGWSPLPFVVLVAALMGLGMVAIVLLLARDTQGRRQLRLPLGSLLAASALMLTVSGHTLVPSADGETKTVNLPLDGQGIDEGSLRAFPVLGVIMTNLATCARPARVAGNDPAAGG